MTTLVDPWSKIASGLVRPADARAVYLSSYAIVLSAVGSAGSTALVGGGDWKSALTPLKDIDFTKQNAEWQGYCMIGDEVVTRVTTRRGMADLVRSMLGLGPKPSPTLA